VGDEAESIEACSQDALLSKVLFEPGSLFFGFSFQCHKYDVGVDGIDHSPVNLAKCFAETLGQGVIVAKSGQVMI
jgi:hypothetical protein